MATRQFNDLLQIVRNGGGLDIHIGGLTRENLVQLVANVKEGSTIILRGSKAMPTDELVQIAANATKGAVIFVDD